jgi:N-acetylglucosamine kinase-like BadF-type ATPase
VIGVDGGGTKTLGCIATLDGHVKAWAVGSPSNYQVLGARGVRAALEPLVTELLQAAAVDPAAIVRAVFALSGCGRPEDRNDVENALSADPTLLPRVRVEHDGTAALAGAFGAGPGIILISGTGVICLGRTHDGRMARAGGWGYLLGDEGSGFYVGQQGLIAALKDYDGRGPKTALRRRLEEHFAVDRIDQIIPTVYRKPMDRGDFAALAPLVFELARQGDAVARDIVRNTGREQGQLVKAVVERLGMGNKKVRLALVGNIFRARDLLLPEIESQLVGIANPLEVVEPRFIPAIGAAILAMEAAGRPPDEEVLRNLEESGPGFPSW